MGIVSLTIGIALFATSVLTRSDRLMAITSIVVGADLERSGPLAGSINITLGILLLLTLRNRRRRRRHKGTAATGAKSRALRDALARRVRNHAIPVPA